MRHIFNSLLVPGIFRIPNFLLPSSYPFGKCLFVNQGSLPPVDLKVRAMAGALQTILRPLGLTTIWHFGSSAPGASLRCPSPRDIDLALLCENRSLWPTIGRLLRLLFPGARIDQGGYTRTLPPPKDNGIHFLLLDAASISSQPQLFSSVQKGICVAS